MHGVTNLVEHPIQMAPPGIDTYMHRSKPSTNRNWLDFKRLILTFSVSISVSLFASLS